MDSSETGGGVVDSGVGSIVWVRRRNGSWWPGKVLGPDELSSSHVTSPRSGTPVKLLGREDASVDWYNLEKSKRVKAFRCGEFNDCIERAEAAQGMPPKKREKYARREDAILHALELERQLLEKTYGNSGLSYSGKSEDLIDAVTYSEDAENSGGNQASPRSNQAHDEHGSPSQDKKLADNSIGETLRGETRLSGDDGSVCVQPRVRGLQDFGLRIDPQITKGHPGIAFRAKRSRYAYLNNDSGNYQSSELGIPVSKREESSCLYSADLGEDYVSGSTEDTETDCLETDSLESNSDDEATAFSDGSASIELRPKYPRRIESHEEHGSISSNDLDDFSFPDDSPHSHSANLASTSMRKSKWQLKRKRNNLSLGKDSLDRRDAELSRGYTDGRNSNSHSISLKADAFDRSFRTSLARYGSTGLHNSCHNNVDIDYSIWNNPPAMRGYWEDLQEYVNPSSHGTHHLSGRIILIDVDLKVQASNYPRDVPLISLMSKLNGHAIVGHPIQTEFLESGSSENLLVGAGYSLNRPALPRVWKTGRRSTNSRVPRPNLSPGKFINQDRKLPFSSDQGSYSQKTNIPRNGVPHHPGDWKFARNPYSNPKIRTLSSIALEQKHHNDPPSSGVSNYQVNGPMKTGYLHTTVACIPVNLVFSRLHEELVGRHQ